MPHQGRYERSFAITPSDTVNFTKPCAGIHVGGAGNITLIDLDGNVRLFTAPTVGAVLPMAAKRVNATGTTATALIGLF